MLKVRAAVGETDPGAWDYPAREGLSYGLGLLAALPGGLTAPRCLAVETQPDGTSRVGATAMPATALCDQKAGPLVVLQANRAPNVGGSVCGDPNGETEGRELHLARPRHPGFQEAPEPGPSGRCEVPSCLACAAAGTPRTAPARSVSARRRVAVSRIRVRGYLSAS